MSHLVMYAVGVNGQVRLFEDWVEIRRTGLRSSLSARAKQTDIPLPRIGSVEFKPAGTFTNGFIQFVHLGQAPKTGLVELSSDDNSVSFSRQQQPTFERVKSAVEERMAMLKQNQAVLDTGKSRRLPPPESEGVMPQHGLCSKCGKPLLQNANFCLACGRPTSERSIEEIPRSLGARTSLYRVSGDGEDLEVFEDKLTITSIGFGGGRKAAKTILFASITGITYQKPGLTNGYIRFTIPGGPTGMVRFSESPLEENTFHFAKENSAVVEEVKGFIERKMQDARAPRPSTQTSAADELLKLASLKEKGLLSEEEFVRAKAKLLGL